MKTLKKPRLTILNVLLIICFTSSVVAQSTLLHISTSDGKNDWINYGPGTEFEFRDKTNTIVFSAKTGLTSFKFHGDYTLTVKPTYTVENEVFKLSSGKIELVESTQDDSNYGYYDYDAENFTNGLSFSRSYVESETHPGQYDVHFTFSNGIKAIYADGKMTATLFGESLKIEGKYFIYSELGLLKFSYSPSSKDVWYVFEPKK